MIFNTVGRSSGGASEKPYILIFADAPQYIEGKYLRVSLGGDEIYADSIPTNVDALTLQITEAGTYTIGLYASSSASTATESHTVLVDNLNASPSVHFGERVYKDENAGTTTYYTQSDTSIKSSSTLSGTSSGATSSSTATILYNQTWTPSYSGFIRFKFSGSLKGNYSGTANVNTYAFAQILNSNGERIQTLSYYINGDATTAKSFSLSDDKIYVEAGATYTIKVGLYVTGGYSTSTATLSSGSVKVCGSSTTYTLKNTGIISKAIKSIQFGISTTSNPITISAVNPNNSILEWRASGYTKKPETPTQFMANATGNWILTEYY